MRGYCRSNDFLIYLFMILFRQPVGEWKSLPEKVVQRRVAALKVCSNFGAGIAWSRICWIKFPNLCCAEFTACGICPSATCNQQHFFQSPSFCPSSKWAGAWCLTLSTLNACDCKLNSRCSSAVCCCWRGKTVSLILTSTTNVFTSLTWDMLSLFCPWQYLVSELPVLISTLDPVFSPLFPLSRGSERAAVAELSCPAW